MRIELEYLRQFYPTGRPAKIVTSPFGNIILKDDISYESELETEKLLNEIKGEYGIPYKIRLVSNEHIKKNYPKYQIETHKELYNEIIKRRKVFEKRGKVGWDKELRNSSGSISVGYTLLIKLDGEIEWFEGMNAPRIIYLLEQIWGRGEEFLKRFFRSIATKDVMKKDPMLLTALESIKGDTEKETELLKKLVKSGMLGIGTPMSQFGVKNKWIDLLYEKEDEIWIIEAKERIDWGALGQVIGYDLLFRSIFNPEEPHKMTKRKVTRMGIVYSERDQVLEECCDKLKIRRFKENELESKLVNSN